jgi:Coenzyme PQQ synthesis protein D (PqqD)
MAKGSISKNAKVVMAQDQVSCDLSGEAAILNLKSGVYFGLNTVGASIWKLIQEPRTINEIRDALVEEYEVEPKRCERDILELLQELSSHELIKIIDEKNT